MSYPTSVVIEVPVDHASIPPVAECYGEGLMVEFSTSRSESYGARIEFTQAADAYNVAAVILKELGVPFVMGPYTP